MKTLIFVGTVTLAIIFGGTAEKTFADWHSGGGGALSHKINPWFISNTTEVNYCLDLSSDFGVTRGQASKLVRLAFEYWQKQLHSDRVGTKPERIASQSFVETSNCQDAVLKFQLGTLTPEQQQYISEPKEFIGIAVQTNYDTVHMRGEGFIYISPNSGPNRYEHPDSIENPWQQGDGGILHKVLVHELGHVFGFPHITAAFSTMYPTVMAHNFVHMIVENGHAPRYRETGFLQETFFPARKKTNINCRFSGEFDRYLGVNAECMLLEVRWDRKQIDVFATKDQADPYIFVGSISLDKEDLTVKMSLDYTNSVIVHLPPDNIVYPPQPGQEIFKYGPSSNRYKVGSFLETSTGTRPIVFTFDAQGLEIFAENMQVFEHFNFYFEKSWQ